MFFTGVTEIILTGFSSFSLTPVSAASELCSLWKKNKPLLYVTTWTECLLSHYTDKEVEAQAGLEGVMLARFRSMFTGHWSIISCYFFFFKDFIYFLRGREGEREEEKHQCVAAPCMPHTGDPARNPGMCPGWESNWWRFGSQAGTQSTQTHQLGLFCVTDFHMTLLI